MVQITLNDIKCKEKIVCEVEQVVTKVNRDGTVTVQSRYGNSYKVELISTLSIDTISVYDHLVVRKLRDGRWVAIENIGNPNKIKSRAMSVDAFVDAFMDY